jgi:hypothetical protein
MNTTIDKVIVSYIGYPAKTNVDTTDVDTTDVDSSVDVDTTDVDLSVDVDTTDDNVTTVKSLKSKYKTFKDAKLATGIRCKSWDDLVDRLNKPVADDVTGDNVTTVKSLKSKYKTFKDAKLATGIKCKSWDHLVDKLNNSVDKSTLTDDNVDQLKQCLSDAKDQYIFTHWCESTLRSKYKTFKDAKEATGIKAKSWFSLALALNGRNKSN